MTCRKDNRQWAMGNGQEDSGTGVDAGYFVDTDLILDTADPIVIAFT
ncbi:MAG: hypothetical protein IPG38_05495 [Chitinophagaceae bacterium]|nr:hypothetical protein [Chitinophagaceae bacterium]